jgi:hypothetical protein
LGVATRSEDEAAYRHVLEHEPKDDGDKKHEPDIEGKAEKLVNHQVAKVLRGSDRFE